MTTPVATTYFLKPVDTAPNTPILHVPRFCGFTFKHLVFLNLFFFSFVHPNFSVYVNIHGLNLLLGFINNNNIWSSIFNLDINFVHNNCIWLVLVTLCYSFKVMFFTYYFWFKILHSLVIWHIVSFSTSNILRRDDSAVLFIWSLT